MLPKSSKSSPTIQSDAELEWLLCLASTLQAQERKSKKRAVERQPPPRPAFLRGLHALLKSLRRAERTKAA